MIREIRSIRPIEEHAGYSQSLSLKKVAKRYEGVMPTSGDKLNIFEGDPKDVDEKLQLIEKENRLMTQSQALAPTSDIRTLDVTQRSSKWDANLNYLKSQLSNKESRKDFILQSRELLFKEISIRNKKEETEKLKEFIDTENEKLVEAKNSFKEDSDKFQ